MEDNIHRMFERDDTACKSFAGFECLTCNNERGNTPLRETAVERFLLEHLDDREGGRNRTTSEDSSLAIISHNGRPSNSESQQLQKAVFGK